MNGAEERRGLWFTKALANRPNLRRITKLISWLLNRDTIVTTTFKRRKKKKTKKQWEYLNWRGRALYLLMTALVMALTSFILWFTVPSYCYWIVILWIIYVAGFSFLLKKKPVEVKIYTNSSAPFYYAWAWVSWHQQVSPSFFFCPICANSKNYITYYVMKWLDSQVTYTTHNIICFHSIQIMMIV